MEGCVGIYIERALVENLPAGGMLSRLYNSKPYMIKYLIYMSSSPKVQLQFSTSKCCAAYFVDTDLRGALCSSIYMILYTRSLKHVVLVSIDLVVYILLVKC